MNHSDKILVLIYFPVLAGKYEFLIDPEKTVKQTICEIIKEIGEFEKTEELMKDISDYRLFFDGADLALEENVTLREYGIVSGSRLMLV